MRMFWRSQNQLLKYRWLKPSKRYKPFLAIGGVLLLFLLFLSLEPTFLSEQPPEPPWVEDCAEALPVENNFFELLYRTSKCSEDADCRPLPTLGGTRICWRGGAYFVNRKYYYKVITAASNYAREHTRILTECGIKVESEGC